MVVDKLIKMIDSEQLRSGEIKKTDLIIKNNNAELGKLNSYMVGQELRMIGLKKKIEELEEQKTI